MVEPTSSTRSSLDRTRNPTPSSSKTVLPLSASHTPNPSSDSEKYDLESQLPTSTSTKEPLSSLPSPTELPSLLTADGHPAGGPLSSYVSGANRRNDKGVPPDGGAVAWTQALIAHSCIATTWGLVASFGAFSPHYVEEFGRTTGDISWIGSIQTFILFFVGTFSGRISDAGYLHEIYLLGSILQILAMFLWSLSTTYWHVVLTQGVMLGFSNGLLFCPVVSNLSTYFVKRRAIAIGIGATGSATGGLIYPVMVRELLPKIGFAWTIRSLAFLNLAFAIFCNACIRSRVPPRKSGPIVEWSAFREPTYALYAASMFLTFTGLYFPSFDIGIYAKEVIGMNVKDAAGLLLVINGVGVPGRLIPSFFADRFGPLTLLIPATIIGGVGILAWAAVIDRVGLYIFAVFYGIFSACVQALFPATLSSLTGDPQKAGVRMGMIFSVVSFAVLIGPPIAGVLITKMDGNYLGAQIFGGGCMLVGSAGLMAARVAKVGWKINVKI